ncbi:MAG: TonB-dependent receptor plug domain-containing protein [Maribacter sp.]|nr:TonB-dependent receptor plug domain-containing protein [Maribacter sp.]
MNKNSISLVLVVLASASCLAQRQHNDTLNVQRLDEVVVSDSRFELKRENSGKTVIRITSQEILRQQGKTVAEIINDKSGIEIGGSRGREGAVLGVYVRGGRGRQVLVLIDGIRVADPSSFSQEFDLRLLSTANIESIEIIKGAASTLYGANAATAVISITTKQASRKRASLNVETSRGTNQTVQDQNYNLASSYNGINLSGTLDKFTYRLGFSNRFSEGLSALVTKKNEPDIFSVFGTDMNLGYQISKSFKINIFGNQTKLRTDYDESFGLIDAPYQFKSEQKRSGISSEFSYLMGEMHFNLAYAEFDSKNISNYPGTFNGNNYSIDLYNKLNINNVYYTIMGLSYIKDQTKSASLKDFTLLDPYANLVYVSPFGFNINLGTRLNHHSGYGDHFVYNFNPSFRVRTSKGYLKILGSYATAYITPSLNQLFGEFGANPELGPEVNKTLESGFEYDIPHQFRLSAVYFNILEENAVIYNNLTQSYLNATSTIRAQGVEVEVQWKPIEKIQFLGNYAFTQRKGDLGIRIPKHKVNASLGYEVSDRMYASFDYSMTGSRRDTDFSNFEDLNLPSYSLVDLFANYEVWPGKLRVFIGISNMLNVEYIEITGYTSRGRNVRAGINFSL